MGKGLFRFNEVESEAFIDVDRRERSKANFCPGNAKEFCQKFCRSNLVMRRNDGVVQFYRHGVLRCSCRLTFDMIGGRKWAKPACGRPRDGRVRALAGHGMYSQKRRQETYRHAKPEQHFEPQRRVVAGRNTFLGHSNAQYAEEEVNCAFD